jgi:hypothetical protein
MPEVLQYLMEQSDDAFKRQIQYIIEQLNSNADQDDKDAKSMNANEGEEGDDDEDEDEDDEDDEMYDAEDDEMYDAEDPHFNFDLVGEELLMKEFVED